MADPDQGRNGEHDGEEYSRLLAHAKGYLPFLMIIINSENLDIQKEHKEKLRSLYEMVDAQRLSTSKLKSCQSVFCSLYAKYHRVLSEEQLRALNNARHNVQSSSEDCSVSGSSDVEPVTKESEQKPISKSESPNKMSSLNIVENKTLSIKQDSVEHGSKVDEESTSKQEKIEKFLKFAFVRSVDKLNKSDNGSSGSADVAKSIYDGFDEKEKEIVSQKLINGFNFDDIDVNLVSKYLQRILHGNSDSIEPPPLPPPEILDLGLSKELAEFNVKPLDSADNSTVSTLLPEASQHTSGCVPSKSTSGCVPSKSTSLREKLTQEISKIHKIGSSDEPKSKIISSLKPGTLRDLEKSKSISSSLHIESLRPTVKSNETFKPVALTNVKKVDYVPLVTEINARDPRKKKNLLSSSENSSSNPINKLSSPTNQQRLAPVPKVSNQSSELILPLMSINVSMPFPSSTFELKQQEKTSYCSKSNFPQHELPPTELSYYPERVINKPFHGSNPSTQYQHEYNPNEFNYGTQQNDIHPYNSSNQTYIHHDLSRYSKSGSDNNSKENLTRRDPRLVRNDQKSTEPPYRSFKEYREAKYGKNNSTNKEHTSSVHGTDHYRARILEKDSVRHTDKTKTDLKNNNPYNALGTISDIAASIKGFKIPKVKRKEEVDINKDKDLKIEKVVNSTDKYRRAETPKDGNSDKYRKSDTTKYSIGDKSKNNALITNSYSDKNRKTDAVNQKEIKTLSTDDKIEKCLKTEVIKNLDIRNNETRSNTEKGLKPATTKYGTKKELKSENCSKPVTNAFSNAAVVSDIETKSKKQKKYSKEKEFKKIVKEAVASSKDDDLIGPRTRTRNVLKNNEQTFDFFDKSHQNHDETGHNVISSTSKDPPEIDSSTESVCNKRQEETIDSTNVVHSTADVQSSDEHLELTLQKEKLMAIINVLDKSKLDRLKMLLDSPQIANILENKVDDKSTSNNVQFVTEEQTKSKKKKKRKKKKIIKVKNENLNEKPLDDEKRNCLVDSLNEGYSKDRKIDVTESVKSYIEESIDGKDFNCSTNNLSANKIESNNDNEYKPSKGLTTCNDKSKLEFRDVKIIISKVDEGNFVSNAYSTDCQQAQGSQNKSDENTQSLVSNSETTSNIISKKKKQLGSKIKKNKTELGNVEKIPQVSQESEILSTKCTTGETPLEEAQTQCEGAVIEQNLTETNVNVNSKSIKKPRSKTTELDKLHAYMSEMYDCDAILNIANVRHCRRNKLVDYANNGLVFAKKSNTSKVDQLDSYDHNSYEFDEDFENPKPKSTKKQSKLFKKNKNKNFKTKRSKNNGMLIKKRSYDLPLVNKSKSNFKAKKKLNKKKKELNVCNSEKAVEMLPKILIENSFKDKSYFQSTDICLECKYCLYSDKGFNIVRHYVEQHRDKEVLPSRLPNDCAERLINESLKENYGFFNSEDLKLTKCAPVNSVFTCVFCQLVVDDIIQFYDHITSHTGEYRYKCKMCEHVYSCANELEKHILEHSDYDKINGIAHLLHSSPTQNVFGYLCPFCNFIQLDYNNIVKHMMTRHNNEDKRFNGYWTVVRVNMSFENENNESIVIDYTNLVGCLPPVPNQQACQTISKTHNPEDKTPIKQLVVEACKNLIGNVEHILFDEPPQETQKAMPHLSPKPAIASHENKSEISTINFECGYTMKENCQLVTVAQLSCVLVDHLLMFKCCVSDCSNHPFSTVDLSEFVKHIEQSHSHTVWNRMCSQCCVKVEKVSEECLVIKDALKHLVSHHLVLNTFEDFNTCENVVENQNESTPCQNNIENVPTRKDVPSKPFIRCVPLKTMVASTSTPLFSNIENALSVKTSGSSSISETLSVLESDVNRDVVTNDSLPVNEALSVPSSNDNNIDTTKQYMLETVSENVQLSHAVLEELSVNETNSIESDNLGFRIDKIMSLNEDIVTKKKVLKKTVSGNSGLRIVLTPEVTTQNFQYKHCRPGYFIVNDGTPLEDFDFQEVDTEYIKCYSKHVKDFPINMLKTRNALNEMTTLPKLLDLFKCMDRYCTKTFTQKDLFKLHMKLHFSNAEKKNKSQTNNPEHFRKCAYCYKKCNDEDNLAEHIAEQYSFCRYFCPYCFYRAYTPTHVLIHIHETHLKAKHKVIELKRDENCNDNQMVELPKAVNFAKFVLPFVCKVGSCKFSCYLPENFTYHLIQEHQQCSRYCCYLCEKKNNTFFALQPNRMVDHFKIHGIYKYQCLFCLFGTINLYPMLRHLSTEHFEFNPICLERVIWQKDQTKDDLSSMKIMRLSLRVDNGVLETIHLSSENSSLPVDLHHKSKKRDFERCDVITAAMKSARIPENVQAPDTIVISVPDSAQFTDITKCLPDISNEFIMLDDMNGVNDKKETVKLALLSGSGNSTEKPQQSPDDDSVIIIDDDEDDFSSNNEENDTLPGKRKRLVHKSSIGSNKSKRLALPIISLDKLFDCKACGIHFKYSQEYLFHLNTCTKDVILNVRRCPFCSKSFKTDFHITEHLKLHGPDRFSCSTCGFRAPSKRAIEHHMRINHDIKAFDFVPLVPDLDDPEKDEFIVHEDLINSKKNRIKKNCYSCSLCKFFGRNYRSIQLHMKDTHLIDNWELDLLLDGSPSNENTQHYIVKLPANSSSLTEQNESVKRKHSGDHSDNSSKKKMIDKVMMDKIDNGVRSLNMIMFSPDMVHHIPMQHIFAQHIGCSLCTYNTKVRSNLILHLKKHKEGQDSTTKEIVNPVPSMGKSDLMFDKMINLAASSMEAMNTERMKTSELNKKIVEVTSNNHLNIGSYPDFVDTNERFKCSICSGHFSNGDMLKTHVLVIHPQFSCYRCPHSPCVESEKVVDISNIEFHLMHHGDNLYGCQYCSYIDFNRSEMRTHMRTNHLQSIITAQQSNIFVIRQNKLEDDSLGRSIHQDEDQFTKAEWICNLCSSSDKYTKNDIKSHIFIVHQVSKMFKCPMCQFEHDDNDGKVFEDHYRVEHPSVAVQCLTVYEKVTYVQEQPNPPKYMRSPQYMFDQQALESIEPSIVPPACRGIPVESAGKTMYNKSRVGTKSPKSVTKSSPVSKQKVLTDSFSVHDSLGELSASGLYSCPKCKKFETLDINMFRMHLYKDVNYKTWKCMNCFEISDSPKKMAWHVKKHGDGSKYERIEDTEKLNWIDKVLNHQYALKIKFDNRTNVNHKEQGKIVNSDKNLLNLSLKKTNDENKKKALDSQAMNSASNQNNQIPTNIDVINLLDDSDDE